MGKPKLNAIERFHSKKRGIGNILELPDGAQDEGQNPPEPIKVEKTDVSFSEDMELDAIEDFLHTRKTLRGMLDTGTAIVAHLVDNIEPEALMVRGGVATIAEMFKSINDTSKELRALQKDIRSMGLKEAKFRTIERKTGKKDEERPIEADLNSIIESIAVAEQKHAQEVFEKEMLESNEVVGKDDGPKEEKDVDL